MQLDYTSTARENNCYVVGACGFDSIPADMGTVFLEQEFGGQVNSVETYLDIKAKHVYFFALIIKYLVYLVNALFLIKCRDFTFTTELGKVPCTDLLAPTN